jgi:hypothetical protein
MPLILALLAFPFQQPATPATEIATIVVSPASRTMIAGDTLRLRAEARDARGNVIPGVTFTYRLGNSARFEGRVDSLGLVTAGSTSILPVTVTATSPDARPRFEVIEIRVVPGPAAKIEVSPASAKLVAGQRLRATARAFSAANDKRADRILWKSSDPTVATVTDAGLIAAGRAGNATITASVGTVSARLPISVAAGTLASLSVSPANVDARTGDVLRFAVNAKDAAGKTITGLTPTWSFSPGHGSIDGDGAFVGYEAGEYTVIASFGTRSVEATVTLAERDVRRPLSLVGRLPRSRFSTEEVWVPPGRQARVPRLRLGRRRAVRDRHQRSNQSHRHRFSDLEHAPRERRHDVSPTASFSCSRARERATARTASSSARSTTRRIRR